MSKLGVEISEGQFEESSHIQSVSYCTKEITIFIGINLLRPSLRWHIQWAATTF